MDTSSFGFVLAVVGLAHLLAFHQTVRRLSTTRFSAGLAALVLPLFVAAMWRIALGLGWWTILVFVAAGLLAGIIHGVLMRRHGRTAAFNMQTLEGLVAVVCIGASWILR